LAPESPALSALAAAVRGGLALAATGGEQAFGAGGHPEGGEWERLLPVTMRPEDDRTRSLLFVLDASHSMNDQTAQGVKLHFARAQIGQVLQDARAVRPTDRLGLLVFSGRARLAAPMSGAEGWKEFLEALAGVRTEDRTHFLAALELARRTLAEDRSEQQIVIFISDGVPVPGVVDEELKAAVEALCRGPVAPGGARRTVLHTFGIGTGPADSDPQGLRRLQEMARAGGGECFPNFMELAASLGRLLRQAPPDFYVRREPFGTRPVQPIHPLVRMMGEDWPELPFRNRLKARPEASVLLESAPRPGAPADGPARRPDPLLALGHCAAARTAALALSLQGDAGRAFLAPQGDWPGGQKLLAALLSWLEGEDRGLRSGWRIEAEPEDEKLSVRLTAEDPGTRAPLDGLNLSARLAPLGGTAPAGMAVALLPVAPGRYEAQLPLPARDMRQGEALPDAWRLEVIEEGRVAAEQFVTVPYPAEYRRFGTDRLALEALVRLAGGRSRLINLPEVDLRAWLKELGPQREYRPARPVLLVLAALCLLCEVVVRGMRRRVV
jgi:Mg-chelatase subunit ChlD